MRIAPSASRAFAAASLRGRSSLLFRAVVRDLRAPSLAGYLSFRLAILLYLSTYLSLFPSPRRHSAYYRTRDCSVSRKLLHILGQGRAKSHDVVRVPPISRGGGKDGGA